MRIRRSLQQVTAVVVLPISGAVFFGALALSPFTGSRIWRVCLHVAKNTVRLLPRLPGLLQELWTDRMAAPPAKRTSLPLLLLAATVGLPFIVVLLLLDDYP